jgi:transposase-like protein
MKTYGVDLMGRRRRRRHSAEFKAAVIEECMRPGVSIAAVAQAHGLNANMLRKWVIEGEYKGAARAEPSAPEPEAPQMPPPAFIPLALPAPTVDGEIQIELQRTGMTVKIVWPAGAARECAAWL